MEFSCGIDTMLINIIDANGADGLGLQKTPTGWWGIPRGKLTPMHYDSLRGALIEVLGDLLPDNAESNGGASHPTRTPGYRAG